MADWIKIRADYVSGGVSYSELSERHGVPLGSIKRHAAQEGWAAKRTETEPNRYQKTVRKVIERKAEHEADRITRLLSIGDKLAAKLDEATGQLDQKIVTHKRKTKTMEYGDQPACRKALKETTVEEEILEVVDAPLDRQGLQQLTTALKNLNDVAKAADPGNAESLTKARELLEGLPSAID